MHSLWGDSHDMGFHPMMLHHMIYESDRIKRKEPNVRKININANQKDSSNVEPAQISVLSWSVEDVGEWAKKTYPGYDYSIANPDKDGICQVTISEKKLPKTKKKSSANLVEIQRNRLIKKHRVTDVFISYRRCNGSANASLLQVLLNKFVVFLDQSGLDGGRFDTALIEHIQKSKNFLLVLTPNCLDRCIHDEEDWIRREIRVAKESGCNIIPVAFDGFTLPKPEELPEDIRDICYINAVVWNYGFQEASFQKLLTFMKDILTS